ncbi:AEC family transporter [Larsenimonas rhizosphaerae]|uniref:AEC family transporter n=1 Tax=Larsenimonas rhizosphaerae TaxID=2944682 RepID=A0AA41ZFE4_9GAMM|nr:AEC family transporter [Larsenimonas rhizosphaerae]MCM2130201.1 AEC family transporter [Larsenimonas rhizosphaerae]MCX2522888.1 AEC family transporter [Larsenimonas rhizosphaerae]
MFAQLLAVMAPVFAGAGVGFFWVRLGQPYPTGFITKLVLNVGTPCLIISSLASTHVDPDAFYRMAGATIIMLGALTVVALIISRVFSIAWQVILPPTLFPNTGNMGLPVMMYAFKDTNGFPLAIAIFVVVSLAQFIVGGFTASRHPLKSLARMPTIYAIIIALLLMAFEITLPLWLRNSIDLLAGFTIPMMLITLGVSLASIRASNLKNAMLFSIARVIIAGSLAAGVGYMLDLPMVARYILIAMMCMPVAVYNYLFAQKSGRSPEFVASLVLCSTLLSFIYMPLLLGFFMHRM